MVDDFETWERKQQCRPKVDWQMRGCDAGASAIWFLLGVVLALAAGVFALLTV